MEEFHRDIYETALKEDEIVTEVVIPPFSPGVRTTYLRFSGNSPIDWPCLGVAGSLMKEDGRCKELRIAVGCLTSVPVHFQQEAESLKDKKLTSGVIKKFARSCTARIEPISDDRGSEWYKKQIAEVYIRRTIQALLRESG